MNVENPLKWSEWRQFPNPAARGIIIAPFGPGCYELRNGVQLVLFGKGWNVAARMTSLLPVELGGAGTRNNREKRDHVGQHLENIEYRTLACASRAEAIKEENKLKQRKNDYRFPT